MIATRASTFRPESLRPEPLWRAQLYVWSALALIYLGWLLVFWPGVLGEDSAAILMEVDQPDAFRSGKSVVWYVLVRVPYGLTHQVEWAVGLAMLLCAFFLARPLAWFWCARRRILFGFLFVFVAAAPHMVYFAGSLYPDALFAAASTALLFEIGLMLRQRNARWSSVAFIAIAMPFALFVRPNGVLYLLPLLVSLFFIPKAMRVPLAAVIGFWCVVVAGVTQWHKSTSQDALDSLVLFETAHLLQPRAMNDLWQQMPDMNDPWVLRTPKLSPRTMEILLAHTTREKIIAYSDPVYWDMLIFHPEGPQLGAIPVAQRKQLTREFLRYNLWHNLPEVVASRVNVFLSAALAQGGFPALDYAKVVLPRTNATSQMRRFALDKAERALRFLHMTSYRARWLLWTPFVGIALIGWCLWRGVQQRDAAALVVAGAAAIQLLAIVAFASAGEYRYLLPFFTLPLALGPLLATRAQRESVAKVTRGAVHHNAL